MRIIRNCIAAAMVFSLGGAAPAAATPIVSAATVTAGTANNSGEIIKVRNRDFRRHHRDFRGKRSFHRRGGHAWYNGYRGRRHPRRGWRQHDGWWFPPAAFALGAIIGGAFAEQPHYYRYRSEGLPRRHILWCERHYQTYRRWDNSFVPRIGVRAQCASPYWP